jgi:outer membrane translocation and assembly module TamA
MDDMIIKGTSETPTIEFNPSKGNLLIEGRSIPENSIDFFAPLMDALEGYNTPPSSFIIDFKLEYFNTSSSKCILDVLRKLQSSQSEETAVTINWHYDEDDDEILEIGQDYSHIIEIPFNFKMIPAN